MEKLIILTVAISVAAHTIINLRTKIFSKQMLQLLGCALFVSLIANKDNPDFSFNKMLLAIPVCFVVGVGALYKNETLPQINERSLHLISLVYLYALIINLPVYGNYLYFALALIPVIVVIYYAIVIRDLKSSEKILLYCLTLCFLIFIEFYNLKNIVTDNLPSDTPTAFNIHFAFSIFFITGILFYIIIYFLNLIWSLPIPAKDESNMEMKERVKSNTSIFIEKVSDDQASPLNTIIITVIMMVFMMMNIAFRFIPNSFITEVFLLTILVFYNKKRSIPHRR